ncbi:DUF7946 domain-containing protein [Falsiroseomonas stagni]|uniref:DUF7946 domain-containing protein n=1 Tax=Falsiroseomonas stagni DSM 19981 TaxID=1123062 RepID=A0A1I4AFW6_9PROT|nr:hypothetical protein [Falsiroseomonas stagni]SFK54831.1 hypothetical protein SAMN02745775_103399 [Falsiroseomonas stagni DSM 19981]
MVEVADFQLKLSGDTSDRHEFQGYDGYTALAGFAWALALAAHFADTGTVRQRGDFTGRQAVRANIPKPGSIIADFSVVLLNDPIATFNYGTALAGVSSSVFLTDLVKRLFDRNLGRTSTPTTPLLQALIEKREGDVEALTAKVEPAIKQTHRVIDNGAAKISVLGGYNMIANLDRATKDYVNSNYQDNAIKQKDFSVASFNANSGYGSVFDFDLGRTVAFSMSSRALADYGGVFSWGLDQYANRTNRRINIQYTRILAMDETPKRYIVLNAQKVDQ